MCVMWRMSQICVGCKSLHKYLQKILEIQKESNRNPTRDKSEDNDFQGYQSFVDSQEGRMSLTLKNSSASARSSAGYAETSRRSSIMPAMPSMKSLMFKEEEFTIGFWPGCQAPDLKEVPRCFTYFFLAISFRHFCHDDQGALLERWHRHHLRLGKLPWKVCPPLVPGMYIFTSVNVENDCGEGSVTFE